MAALDSSDVSDSTDWLGTSLACLMPVEAAFRCHVCKDFYNSPMITSCNHSFCSLCIRRCLSVEGKCPVCRASDQESKLRGNWALRDAVDSFCKARATVLELARAPPAPPPAPAPATLAQSQQQQPTKRKSDDEAGSLSGSQQEPKRTRMSTRLSKTKATEAVASIALEEEEDDDDDDDEVVEVEERKKGSRRGGDADADYKPDDGLIECPICGRRIKMALINSHLDNNCGPSAANPKPTATSSSKTTTTTTTASGFAKTAGPSTFRPLFSGPTSATKPPEPLPSISYSLLSDTALRKKMASLGISTSGPRLLLERRHKEWCTIWNANCDSARPKRKQELLRDLDVWERTIGALVVLNGGGGGGGAGGASGSGRGGAASSSSSSALTSRPMVVAASQQAAMIKDKNFDANAWKEKHSSSFQDLVANARRSRAKAHQPKAPQPDGQPGTNEAGKEADAGSTTPPASEQLVSIPDSNPASPASEPSDDAPARSAGPGDADKDGEPPQREGVTRQSNGRSDSMVVEL